MRLYQLKRTTVLMGGLLGSLMMGGCDPINGPVISPTALTETQEGAIKKGSSVVKSTYYKANTAGTAGTITIDPAQTQQKSAVTMKIGNNGLNIPTLLTTETKVSAEEARLIQIYDTSSTPPTNTIFVQKIK